MTAANLVAEAGAAGVELWSDGQALRYRGNEEAIRKLAPRLKARKPELLALLAGSPGPGEAVQHGIDQVRAWLASIGESDAATVNEVLDACASDPDALAYFLARAAEPLPVHREADEAARLHAERVGDLIRAGWVWHRGEWFEPGQWKPEESTEAEPEPQPRPEPERAPQATTKAGRVACADCSNFIQNRFGMGGIGRCAKLADPPGGLLYPRVERRCQRAAVSSAC
jgi:hypothetical protein